MRHEADRLERRSGSRLRRRRALDNSRANERLVLSAVRRVELGDQEALRFLYLRYADNVYGYVCSLVCDEHEAEDVTQQIFTRLPASLRRYQPQVAPFSGWIVRVAHNAAVDHMRAKRATPTEEVRDPDQKDLDMSRERYWDLRVALDALPEDQRRVFVMRFIAGMSPAEIAAQLGRSEHAVHGLQHRGRRTLKTVLRQLEAAPVAVRAG